MDALYSVSLLLSFIAGGLAVILSVYERISHNRMRAIASTDDDQFQALKRSLAVLVFAASAALAVSVLVHLTWGHGPNTAEALALGEFVRVHPAFLVAAILALGAAALHFFVPKS